ncbi:MAG: hypothetical protein ACR2PZ_03615 [Pseudomonadales bacterium]
MRILVYLAALAIFLFIVNLGAQWLGDDEVQPPAPDTVETSTEAVEASTETVEAEDASSAVTPATVATIEAAVEEPLPELAPIIDSAIEPDAESTGAVPAPAIEPEVSSPDLARSPEANAASAAAADIATAAELPEPALVQATEPSPQATTELPTAAPAAPEAQAAPPSAIERFASNAQDVAEDAVDSVSNTIKNVSEAISGDDGDGLNQPLVPDSIAALMRRHEDRELLVLFWHPQDETVTEAFEWLSRMQTRYGNQGITTVAVNLASELGNNGERLVAHGSNIEQRSDPERILARAFWVQQVPSIYLLGADGNLLRRIEGFDQAKIGSYEDSVRKAARR